MSRRTKEYQVYIDGICHDGIYAVDCYGACEYVLKHLEQLPPRHVQISAQEVTWERDAEHGSFSLTEFDLE